MCLIAIAVDADPALPLVAMANRDEFHGRASAPAQRWDEAPAVVGGRDLVAGGSWLLYGESGRFAAVTNVRTGKPPAPGARSRGELVRGFALGEDSAARHARAIVERAGEFGPFNLLLWDGDALWYAGSLPRPLARRMPPGVHALSNAPIDVEWPKIRAARDALSAWIDDGARDIEPLFAALADEARPDDGALPDTGVGLERERLLSPAFIRSAQYGTRSSTVVVAGRERARLIERRFDAAGARTGETDLRLAGVGA